MTHIRSLKAQGVKGDTGLMLTAIILLTLPADMRLEWAREENKEGDLDSLLNFLKTEVERRERSETYKSVKSTTSKD